MRKNTHGYVPAALMFNKVINELRDHVEYEKFLCRTIVDNDTTKQFKKNTDAHVNSTYRFLYNNPDVVKHTVEGRDEQVNADREQKTT